MFFNEAYLKMNQKDVVRTHHNWFDTSKGFDHTFAILAFFPFFLYFDKFLEGIVKVDRCLRKCLGLKKKWFDRDFFNENLGFYWDCIIGQEQKRWFTKETHMRKELNIAQLDDDNYR